MKTHNLYYLDPINRKVTKVREGLSDAGDYVWLGIPVENSTTVNVVRLPVLSGGLLGQPIEAETLSPIALTGKQWETAYEMLGVKFHSETAEEALCKCLKNPGLPRHSCPYAEDVGNNPDPLYCNCCDACRRECLRDI